MCARWCRVYAAFRSTKGCLSQALQTKRPRDGAGFVSKQNFTSRGCPRHPETTSNINQSEVDTACLNATRRTKHGPLNIVLGAVEWAVPGRMLGIPGLWWPPARAACVAPAIPSPRLDPQRLLGCPHRACQTPPASGFCQKLSLPTQIRRHLHRPGVEVI